MSDIVYLLWSNKHNAWWAAFDMGYTENIDLAGRYTEAQAVKRVVRSASSGDRRKVTLMVAAPENWTDLPAEVAYRCEGCGKTSRIAAHAPGCPVAAAFDTDRPGALAGAPEGEADSVAVASAAGAPPAHGAPAQDPDAPPYASPFAYRAERRWTP